MCMNMCVICFIGVSKDFLCISMCNFFVAISNALTEFLCFNMCLICFIGL
jgi:hypothetical protein